MEIATIQDVMKMTYPTKVKDRDFLVRENGIT